MKRACLVTVMCWLLPSAAFAAPCIPGSLATYVGLGAGGCNIGSATFANFVDLPLLGGASPIPDSGTFVDPITTPGAPGFGFQVNILQDPNHMAERRIGFTLSGPGFTSSQLGLVNSVVNIDGANTAIENECLGAAFGLGGSCGATFGQLTALDLGFLTQLTDSSTFANIALLGVILDITVDGGTIGGASLASATAQFTPIQAAPVPEPATLGLLGLGLAAIAGQRYRARKNPNA